METLKGIAGLLFIMIVIGTCVGSIILSDKNAEKIHEQTHYFKITNKDYVNTSRSITHTNYRWVVYFERYDKDKKRINCNFDLERKAVTKYDYERLEVDKLYNVNEIDILTYGYY